MRLFFLLFLFSSWAPLLWSQGPAEPLRLHWPANLPLSFHQTTEGEGLQTAWAQAWSKDSSCRKQIQEHIFSHLPLRRQLNAFPSAPDSIGIDGQGPLYLGLDFFQEDMFLIIGFQLSSYKRFQAFVRSLLGDKYALRRPWLSLESDAFGLLFYRQNALLVLPFWRYQGYEKQEVERKIRMNDYLNQLVRTSPQASLAQDSLWLIERESKPKGSLLWLNIEAWDQARLADSLDNANLAPELKTAFEALVSGQRLALWPASQGQGYQGHWYKGAWPFAPLALPATWLKDLAGASSIALLAGQIEANGLQTWLQKAFGSWLSADMLNNFLQGSYLLHYTLDAQGSAQASLRLAASAEQLKNWELLLTLAKEQGLKQVPGGYRIEQVRGQEPLYLGLREESVFLSSDSSLLQPQKLRRRQRLGKKQGFDKKALDQAQGLLWLNTEQLSKYLEAQKSNTDFLLDLLPLKQASMQWQAKAHDEKLVFWESNKDFDALFSGQWLWNFLSAQAQAKP